MKVLIHDMEETDFQAIGVDCNKYKIISNNGNIHHCIGCFGCWIKSPGACAIRDQYGDMGEYLSKCDEVIIISKCFYGGFSPFVKNVLDRSISYIHPYFAIRNGEMHHKRRYDNHFDVTVWLYGEDIRDWEKETAKKLVQANAINWDNHVKKVNFIQDISQMKDHIL